ncbi:hypothetical protein ANTQUA_LOCUS9548 [Anthophora quadrimaculata]
MNADTLEDRCIRVTKFCVKLAGIWPWQSEVSKYVTRVITYIIFVTVFSTQMMRVVCFFSLDVLVNQLAFLGAICGVLIKQGNYIILKKEYEELLATIRKDWSIDRPQIEFEIMTKYAERGAFLISTYAANAVACVILFFSTPFTPYILDYFFPRNESRELEFMYPAYYFVDGQKYNFLINLHMASGIFTVYYVYVGCDTSYMYVVQHACGLMAVSGHRFKCAVEGLSAQKKNGIMSNEVYRKVCHSIRGHQHAIKYLNNIENCHVVYFFISICIIMVCFSVILVKVSKASIGPELAKDYMFIAIQLVHIFFLTLQGQFVLDVNEEIYDTIYDAMWYNTDKKTQKLFVLALRNCLSTPRLTAGGLITLSLQSFSEIVKTSVSYGMVLKSV